MTIYTRLVISHNARLLLFVGPPTAISETAPKFAECRGVQALATWPEAGSAVVREAEVLAAQAADLKGGGGGRQRVEVHPRTGHLVQGKATQT